MPRPRGRGLRDAGERAGEVLVVAQRDDPVEREDGERSVVARVRQLLRILAARRGHRVRHPLDPERPREEQTELTGLEVPRPADSLPVERADVLAKERQRIAEMLQEPLMEDHVEGALPERHPERVRADRMHPLSRALGDLAGYL